MKKLFFVIGILFFLISILSAEFVGINKAENVAKSWIFHSNKNVFIKNIKPIKKEGKTLWYLINLTPTGFILISADDAAYPILGYSYQHKFDYPIQSPEVKYWIEHYEKQLKDIISNRRSNSTTIKIWDSILNRDFSFIKSEKNVAPLTQTLWNQGQYYNEQCPYDENSTAGNNHVWAGCVATAMAQVMKYWSYPSTGTGSHSYNEDDYGTLSANFGATTYHWENMPNSPNSVINDVTTLLYHLGVSVDMDYGIEGSGAWLSDAVSSLKTYFSYSSDAQMVWKSDYSTTDWENLLKADLDNGRPILYRGQGDSGGHAFVCDGYEGTNHFHFNWGWSGSANGYYYLNNLNPNGYNFNDYQGAGIHIHPSTSNFPPPTNLTASVSNNTVNLNWNAPSKEFSTYKVYKNGNYLASTTNTYYTDSNVSSGHRYSYYVTAVYTSPDGESTHSNIVTVALGIDLPYSTDFSTTDGWWQISQDCSNRWSSSSTNYAGGSSPELKATWEDANPATTRLVSPPLNTQNYSRLDLSFKHFYDYYSSSDITIKIQSSADGENWTDEVWIHNNPGSNIGPETVNTYITHNLGDITYIAWVITGNLYNFDNWYIDDVSITVPLPVFNLSPSLLEFGSVEVNTNSILQFTISNTGYNTLSGNITTPDNFTVSASSKNINITKLNRNSLSYSIGSGDSETFNVTFSPTEETTYSDNITITSNDPNNQNNYLSVQGEGIAAHISVSPASYSVTLEPDTTDNKNLQISNSGQANLNYTIYSTSSSYRNSIIAYPISQNDWTGTTDGTTKTQHSLVIGYNNEDGWMKFDISSIPAGVNIDSVIFHGYVNDTYWPYWSITPLSNDPVTTDAATLHNDIVEEANSGYYLHRNETQAYSTGWKIHTLGGNITADLKNALPNGWFAIGIVSRDNSTQYYIKFDGWNETHKPYLEIFYSAEIPWLTINNVYSYSSSISANSYENLTIGFNTENMAVGTYHANLQINSNDINSNTTLIPVTLTVQNIPIISVNPQSIDYGNVYIGSPIEHQFTIQNSGHATLTGQIILITDYHINGTSKDETYDFSIGATSSKIFNLQFDPQSPGNHNGNIIINSNDPSNPQTNITVTANALYHAIISVDTDSLYFGEVLLGNYTSQLFTISNNGNENLTGVIHPPAEFYVYENSQTKNQNTISSKGDTLSFNIPEGESKEYIVYFYPSTTGNKNGIINFTSNDPYNNPPQIKVSGKGYLNPPQNVTITIDDNNVILNWDYNNNVSTYHVYSSDKPDSGFTEEGTIPRPPFTILNGATNTKRFYKITAE